jgi:hypothetical protein
LGHVSLRGEKDDQHVSGNPETGSAGIFRLSGLDLLP